MNVVDLVLTVCLLATPNDCSDVHLYFESRGSLNHCMFLAPQHIAKWTEEHPKHRVVRWKCEYPNKERTI
jgi:hypothetical protein